jgi:hypothetical protein
MIPREAISLERAAKSSGLSPEALRWRRRRDTVQGDESGRDLHLYADSLPAAPGGEGPPAGAIGRGQHPGPTSDPSRNVLPLEWLQQRMLAIDRQLARKDRQIEQPCLLVSRLGQGTGGGRTVSTHAQMAGAVAAPHRSQRRHPCDGHGFYEHVVVRLVDPPAEEQSLRERIDDWCSALDLRWRFESAIRATLRRLPRRLANGAAALERLWGRHREPASR